MSQIAESIHRYRWAIVGCWLVVTVGLVGLVGEPNYPTDATASFLPKDAASNVAAQMLSEHFGGYVGLSEAIVIFERADGPLTGADKAIVEKVARLIAMPRPGGASAGDLEGVFICSPGTYPLPNSPLISRSGRAALIIVNVPATFITAQAVNIVEHIQLILGSSDLSGLTARVTGSAGFGHDYGLAVRRSHDRTIYVTIAAVIIILLLVYRSPVAALIPLAAISVAVIVALKLLAALSVFGLYVGMAEQIFVVVLVYGAGVDYSLMLISRHAEYLPDAPPERALPLALRATCPAILASGMTDSAGLLMLSFATYGLFRSTGPSVAIALLVALAASVTLVPALISIAGPKTFWPSRNLVQLGPRSFWPRVATVVTARPGVVLALSVVLLAIPAVQATSTRWVYDTLSDIDDGYQSADGLEMAKRHWSVGEVAPVRVMVRANEPRDLAAWLKLSAGLSRAATRTDGVDDVRSLTQPMGKDTDPITRLLLATAGAGKVRTEYLTDDGLAARMEIVLDQPALSLAAMDSVNRLRNALVRSASQFGVEASGIHIAGATAEMMDTRLVTQADFRRIVALVLTVIFLIVLALVRDVLLTAAMIASTVLSFLATLGIMHWVFVSLGGAEGLDWKVHVFLFVVMVAVGVDYNIFLAARLAQEARSVPFRRAARQAIIHTGPVISSCGLIMAATLGSLMAGDMRLLVQLGLALATGILIDTFIVRPMVLPAFVALTGRTGRSKTLAKSLSE